MNRLIFTHRGEDIISYYMIENEVFGINLYKSNPISIGDVYVGVVDNIVKNIEAVFVRFNKTDTGYFSINDNKNPFFLNNKNTDKVCQGDLVLCQIQKEAMKMKKPMLTTNIEIAGQYCVVMYGKKGINVSSKIGDEEQRQKLLKIVSDYADKRYAIIARTNARDAKEEQIRKDIEECIKKLLDILDKAAYVKSGTCVYKSEPDYLKEIKDSYYDKIDEIVTDDKDLFTQIKEYVDLNVSGFKDCIRLYQDDYPINKLYNLDRAFGGAIKKQIWLKSGGFIVIEPTEALTAIDVNTGKAIKGKKTSMDTFFKINMEAAVEIARQLRIRNLSGIIIVDFIDLDTKDKKNQLLEELRRLFKDDPVKCNVIDMTALNLVEITRKKIKAPLHEIIGEVN